MTTTSDDLKKALALIEANRDNPLVQRGLSRDRNPSSVAPSRASSPTAGFLGVGQQLLPVPEEKELAPSVVADPDLSDLIVISKKKKKAVEDGLAELHQKVENNKEAKKAAAEERRIEGNNLITKKHIAVAKKADWKDSEADVYVSQMMIDRKDNKYKDLRKEGNRIFDETAREENILEDIGSAGKFLQQVNGLGGDTFATATPEQLRYVAQTLFGSISYPLTNIGQLKPLLRQDLVRLIGIYDKGGVRNNTLAKPLNGQIPHGNGIKAPQLLKTLKVLLALAEDPDANEDASDSKRRRTE